MKYPCQLIIHREDGSTYVVPGDSRDKLLQVRDAYKAQRTVTKIVLKWRRNVFSQWQEIESDTWVRPRDSSLPPSRASSIITLVKALTSEKRCLYDRVCNVVEAVANVAKGTTVFWGERASEHIAYAIIVEMLRQMEAML